MNFNLRKYALSVALMLLISPLFQATGNVPQINTSSFSKQSVSQDLSVKEIRSILEKAAKEELRKHSDEFKIEFADGAKQLLKDVIRGGAVRIYAERSNRNDIEKAEKNTRALVDKLIEQGRLPNEPRKVRIVPDTFRKSWSICSIYPFC
jgi:hypothetical protein